MGKSSPLNWTRRKLDELGFVARGKSKHRPRNDPSLYGGPYPFFQTGDIKAADFYLWDHSQTYNDKGLAQSKLWEPGTLCITIAANIAETAVLKVRACFPDSVVGFIADGSKTDVRFIKYYIDTVKMRMQAASRGTTQDNLSLDKLLTFDILTPPLPTQQKIAAILSGYDDLIENNARRIKILEEIAQAIYREWFVHFRFLGHKKVELVPSPLGPIPEGWEARPFLGIADFVNGFAFKPTDWGNIGRPIVKIAELKNGITQKTPRYERDDLPERYNVRSADVLFSWSADLNAYVWSDGDALLNQHLFNVLPHASFSKLFLFHSLKDRMQEFRNRSAGTTMRHIKRSALEQVLLRVPPRPLREAFDACVEPLHSQVLSLVCRNKNLRQTRDLLLPKLISGELDLSDLDINVGDVAA